MNGKLHSLATRLLDAVDPLLGKPRWYRRELARAVAERDRLADARLQLIEQIHKLAASHRQLADNHQRLADNHQSLADNHQELANRLQALAKDRYRLIDRYLVLLQDCLTGSIYEDPPLNTLGQESFDPVLRQYGWDWPSRAHTMIGRARLANIRTLAERVLREEIPGDFIETGVWRGGACILMRGCSMPSASMTGVSGWPIPSRDCRRPMQDGFRPMQTIPSIPLWNSLSAWRRSSGISKNMACLTIKSVS